MRKNIWALLLSATLGAVMLVGCSKKAVVAPKQTDKSAASSKTGTSTGTATTNQSPATHSCGGNGYNGSYGTSGSGG